MGDFRIALINNIANAMGTADLTTTLTITATAGRNGTVVECRGDDPSERMNLVLNIASKHSMSLVLKPQNLKMWLMLLYMPC